MVFAVGSCDSIVVLWMMLFLMVVMLLLLLSLSFSVVFVCVVLTVADVSSQVLVF